MRAYQKQCGLYRFKEYNRSDYVFNHQSHVPSHFSASLGQYLENNVTTRADNVPSNIVHI